MMFEGAMRLRDGRIERAYVCGSSGQFQRDPRAGSFRSEIEFGQPTIRTFGASSELDLRDLWKSRGADDG
jgi:hypothetical protein